ncbi:hypothetical protein CPB86DRAFT_790931, partial [Serendipita vermifera]
TAPPLLHSSVAAPSHSNSQPLDYTRRHTSQAPGVTRHPQPTAGPAPSSTKAYEADQSYSNRGGGGRPVYKERRMTYDGVVSKKEVKPDMRDQGWSLGGPGSRFSVPLNDTPDFLDSAVGIRPASRGRSNSAASQKSNYLQQPMERPDSVRIRKNSLSKSFVHSIQLPHTPQRPYPIRRATVTGSNERGHPIKSVGRYLMSTARRIGRWGWIINRRGGRIPSSAGQPTSRTKNPPRGRTATRDHYMSPNGLKREISALQRDDTPSRYPSTSSLSRSRSRDKNVEATVRVRRSSERSYRDTPRPITHLSIEDAPSQSRPENTLRRRGSDPPARSGSQLQDVTPLGLLSVLQAYVAEKNESREAERVLLDNTRHNAHNLKYNPVYDGYVPSHDHDGNAYEAPIIRPAGQRRRVSDSHILPLRSYASVPMQVVQPIGFTPAGYTPVQAQFVGVMNPQNPLPQAPVTGYYVTDTGQPVAGGHFIRRRGGSLGEMMWTPPVGRSHDIRQYGIH